MFGLAHFDIMPLIYGVVMFFGLWSMWHKLLRGKWLALTIEVSVFALVFSLHGGTMAGGFAAMTCALLAGFVFPKLL
jgi:hypothetical protein